ncbi:MAG: CPBP family intramembrane glutamic endopeptidase [Flavobacterium sp.]|uniref:CPBP family intramembrane glutamic endopeptidase n=1 Tax=Flavobacterium sp. TaxID=239 RepID=UPI00326423C0
MNYPISASNPLFQLTKSEKRLPHLVIAILLVMAFLIVGQVIGVFASMPIETIIKKGTDVTWKSTENLLVMLFLGNTPVILAVYLWMRFYEKRPFKNLGFQINKSIPNYFFGIFIGIILFCSVVGLLSLFNFMTWEEGSPAMQGITVILPTTLLLLGFVIQGATEEILCRGWLMQIIGARYNVWTGILVSASLFGLLHCLNDNVTPLSIINIIVVGIFFSLFALRQGSLWGACGLHSIWNWLQGNFFGLQVSGTETGPTILNLKEIGPDWITGGAFGPEGGFATTIVLCVGIAILLLLKSSFTKEIFTNDN